MNRLIKKVAFKIPAVNKLYEKKELNANKEGLARAYGGCGARDAEIQFLKYRLKETIGLHQQVVEKIGLMTVNYKKLCVQDPLNM